MNMSEMADLLDGLASFLDRFGTKSGLADVRTVSSCFRAFPDETVSGFCKLLTKAKEGSGRVKPNGAIAEHAAEQAVAAIRHFLDHRREYDYAQIDQLVESIAKLKVAEIRAVGVQVECPMPGKTKTAMLATLKNWLSDIRFSVDQSSFSLDKVPAGVNGIDGHG